MFSKVKKPKVSTDEFILSQWEFVQKKGKRKYIWIDGVVKLGVSFPTFVVLIDLLIGDNVFSTMRELTREYLRSVLFTSIAGYSLTTYYWGYLEKWSLNKGFNETLKNKIDFCNYCGIEIKENIKGCPQCGKTLEL